MTNHSRHLEELTYFNAIACLLVVLIHVLSSAVSTLQPDSWQLALVFFPWRLAAFVVPAFLFSGAVKMAGNLDAPLTAKRYFCYMGRRIQKIYLPYLLWNLIYYLAFLRIGYVRGTVADLAHYILTGTLSSPFYYVLITMQFYALLPLWKWLVHHIPWYLGVIVAFPLTYLSTTLNQPLSLLGLSFAYTDRIFPSYLLFWVMGLYAGYHYDAFSRQLSWKAPAWILSFTLITGAVFAAYLQKSRGIYLTDLHVWKFFTDSLSIFLLLSVCRHLPRGPGWLKKSLGFISDASFFVYLSHCFFLTFGTMPLENRGLRDVTALLLCRALLAYGIPFGLYGLWKKCRPHR